MSRPSILSLGSINCDLRLDGVDDMAAGGTIRTSGFHESGGGKAANVAFLAHRIGLSTLLMGRVATDHYADVALGNLRQAGMDLRGVIARGGGTTGIAVITVPKSGDKIMLNASNANMEWTDRDIARTATLIAQAEPGSVLVIDFEIPSAAIRAAVEAAVERELMILADPTFPDAADRKLFPRFSAVMPNQHEAEVLLGRDIADRRQALDAAKELREWGADTVCVKLSDGGCAWAHGDHADIIPAIEVEVVDKTGAGDAFIAAYAAAAVEGKSSREAACWGVAASSYAVTKSGAQDSYPTRDDLLRLLSMS